MIAERGRRWIVASVLLLAALGLATAVAYGGITNRWCGGSDSANTLIVAKSLLAGRGFRVDHIMFYARAFPRIAHPENAFPLLQPIVVAAIALLTHDVFTAAHLLQGAFVFVYLGVLPLVALRRYGSLPAIALAGALVAQERYTLFDRPLNDSGAMVLFAAAALELIHALQVKDHRRRTGAWRRTALLFALATSYKASTIFFLLGLLAAALWIERRAPWKSRLEHSGLVLGAVVAAQIPVMVWYYRAFHEFGVPQNVLMRNFVRTLTPGDGFWTAWERARTYFPAHPGALLSFRGLIEKYGALQTLVVAPLARVSDAVRQAYLLGRVLPLIWIAILIVGALLVPSRVALRLVLVSVLFALLIPVYSHYEERYLYPLRPLMGLAVMEAVCFGFEGIAEASQRRIAVWACLAFAALIGVGTVAPVLNYPRTIDAITAVALAVYLLHRARRQRGEVPLFAQKATAQAFAGAFVVMLGFRVPSGTHMSSPRSDLESIPTLLSAAWSRDRCRRAGPS